MGATKLDGAGAQKMKTLEEALVTLQTVHGMVERMAMEVQNQRPIGVMPQQLKRLAAPLVGQLKGQFGMIADQLSTMLLVAGRGGGEKLKVRSYREHVAQIRTALEMAQSKVKKDHGVEIQLAPE
jgi:hypothetical protein